MALASAWSAAAALGRRNRLAAIGMVLVAVFVLFALFGPWIAPQDPATVNLPSRLQPLSTAHWFGTVPAVILGGAGTLIVVGLWAWMFPELREADKLTPVQETAIQPLDALQ